MNGFVKAKQKEIERLEQCHPLYDRHLETWELYDAVWTGRLSERLQRRYLPKGRTEEENLYKLRLQLSQWTPESQTLVRRVLNHVFRDQPDRHLGSKPHLNAFLMNATPDGKTIDAFMFHATGMALTYGMAFLVVDMPECPSGLEAASREDERAAGLRIPYVIAATPLSVLDWDLDAGERLRYLKLLTQPTYLQPDGERISLKRYTEYTPQEWKRTDVIEEDGAKLIRSVSGEHGLGQVPVVPMTYEMVEPMIGRSYVELSARVDVDIYQTESDRAYDRYDKAHPLLVIKSEDDLDQVYGKNFVVKLRPGEDAGYASTDGRIFDCIEEHIERRKRDIYRFGHVEPPTVQYRVQSGISRVVAQEEEGQLYASVAGMAQDAETEIWELVSRWLAGPREWDEDEKAFQGYIRCPRKFNVLTSQEMLHLTRELTELGAPALVVREMKKQLWAQILGSVAPEVLEEANRATDENDVHRTIEQQIEIARLSGELHRDGVLAVEDVKQVVRVFGGDGE